MDRAPSRSGRTRVGGGGKLSAFWAAIPVLAVIIGASAVSAAEFRGLGALPDRNTVRIEAVSGDGQHIVGSASQCIEVGPGPLFCSDTTHFRWTAETGFSELPGGAIPGGISEDGTTLVGVGPPIGSPGPTATVANRWTAAAGWLDVTGGALGWCEGIATSALGDVVVGDCRVDSTSYEKRPWRWRASVGAALLDHEAGNALDVSADGAIVVGTLGDQLFGPRLAASWTATGQRFLLGTLAPDVEDAWSVANGVSPDGTVVVGGAESSALQTWVAFRWTEQHGMQPLGLLDGAFTEARAASSGGAVIVGTAYDETLGDEFVETGFVWTASRGVRSVATLLEDELGLQLGLWTLSAAVDVSYDGRVIVGEGRNPVGQREGWIAYVPEPSGGIGGMAALLSLIALGRTRARA